MAGRAEAAALRRSAGGAGRFFVRRLRADAVAKALAEANHPVQRMVLVGTAAGYVEGTRSYETEAVPGDTIVIHGSADETVPLANVLKWAEPLELLVVVVPRATTSSTAACT